MHSMSNFTCGGVTGHARECDRSTCRALNSITKGLAIVAALYKGKVHGDIQRDDVMEVDIEFPDTRYALLFREDMSNYPNVTCELRKGDSITDLTKPVTLTVTTLAVW